MSYDYNKVIEALFNNLSSLDEQYFLRKKSEMQLDAQVLNRFGQEKRKIMNLYLDGDYQGVINQCLELEADVDGLRRAGFDDNAILDIVQVASYFAFVNRMADGLGVELEDYWGEEGESGQASVDGS